MLFPIHIYRHVPVNDVHETVQTSLRPFVYTVGFYQAVRYSRRNVVQESFCNLGTLTGNSRLHDRKGVRESSGCRLFLGSRCRANTHICFWLSTKTFGREFSADLSHRQIFSDNSVNYDLINANFICDHASA